MVGLFAALSLHDGVQITPEFARAFDLIEHTSEHIFLTGKAGTGKSTFLHFLRQNTTKKLAVLAPTGVAALNITGQTIHSFFRFKPGFLDVSQLNPIKRKEYRALELLIIDEISMVRADVLDAIDLALRNVRKNSKPFGGVQLCLIGDMFQLPPVVTRDEEEMFAHYYSSPYFFAAQVMQETPLSMIEFTTIHRQQDTAFIDVLNAIRAGHCDTHALEILNSRHLPKATPAEGTIVLTATNALAERINATKLAQLTTPTFHYEGELSGNFGLQGARLPAPEALELKVGAQVMLVKNDPNGRWVNGTIASVEALAADSITVRIAHETHEIKPEKWQALGYEFDEAQAQFIEKTLGSYKQFPLMLAWAITIHKSQGKTLERAIIDLGHGAFASGQLYVALSRCKTLGGIALKQPVSARDILCDERIVAFMEGMRREQPLDIVCG